MNDALRIVAKAERENTPFAERYIEMLQADLGKAITHSVLFNIVDWQWRKGELRTDRQYQHYNRQAEKGMSADAFQANEQAIMDNKSDDKILTEMGEFKEEHSLDMCPVADKWFVYITEGGDAPGVTTAG